jgi:hypothetical protein
MLFKSCYEGIILRQQKLDVEARKSEEAMLLTSVLSYLIKGLVQRPDDMSSTQHMVKSLMITRRAQINGFPSLQPISVSPDLTRVDLLEVEAEDFPVLRYAKRHKPSGARLKTSQVPPAQPATPVQETENPPAVSLSLPSIWKPEDDEWLIELLNRNLAQWLWNKFPQQHKRPNLPSKLLRGPFIFGSWHLIVQPGVPHQERSRRANFEGAINTLFPQNWTMLNRGPQWVGYQESVLQPIRRRVQSCHCDKATYSAELRRGINHILGTWQFLPSVQKRYVWPYEGTGFNRTYMLVANPHTSC